MNLYVNGISASENHLGIGGCGFRDDDGHGFEDSGREPRRRNSDRIVSRRKKRNSEGSLSVGCNLPFVGRGLVPNRYLCADNAGASFIPYCSDYAAGGLALRESR